MKQLSPIVGKQHKLKLDYIIARFMKSKRAYKANNQTITIEPIQEKNCEPQIHMWIRCNVKDHWNNKKEFLDIDLYIPIMEFLKIMEVEQK